MDSDEEQIEELKKWWNENGKTVVVGLVVGLGGIFGWTSWQNYQQNQAELASQMYEQLVNSSANRQFERAQQQANALVDEFPGSGYAPLAALVGAHSAFSRNQPEEARRQLEWVVSSADEAALRDVARVRLARHRLDTGDFEQALSALTEVGSGGFATIAEELRGDIALAKGDLEAAREAFAEALASEELAATSRARVQMKLDDLGHTLVSSEGG